jgi:Lysylphosphatidylglycerol synthase TM region
VLGTLAATGVLVYVLYDKRDEFAQSLRSASIWVLLLASLLQLVAQLFRTEAWHLSVEAAGATCGRRRLFQAAGIGSLASQLNAQLGTAARIGILRRWDGPGSPRVPALIAAEVPIMAVEGGLAAIACFTLVGPLDLPIWSPIPVLAAAAGIVWGLSHLAHKNVHGPWSGLAVLRSMHGRFRIVGLILLATFAQIARNTLVLHALGVPATVFDATAVLILSVMLTQLPIGPSVGAAATVLVLGSNGVAVVAAAGVLLTATGTAGGVVFLLWGVLDRLLRRRRGVAEPATAQA